MNYLDYAANTPIDPQVLARFVEVTTQYTLNPNASNPLAQPAKACLDQATAKIKALLELPDYDVIYTSGATEANNLAIKGVAHLGKNRSKHMITTFLEHASVNGPITALQNQGFEVDFVDIDDTGWVDLEHLEELLRQDTLLVSIGYVDSELGIEQPIQQIRKMLEAYPNVIFHVDATQAMGKIPVCLTGIDCITFSPHKFGGLNGSGVLMKKASLSLEPQMHGGISTSPYRSGTPALGLIDGAAYALERALENQNHTEAHMKSLNDALRKGLNHIKGVTINSTAYAVPHIMNISCVGIPTEAVMAALAKRDIVVATKSACCAVNTPSRPVFALTKDRKKAMATIRISLNYLTTHEEIEELLNQLPDCMAEAVAQSKVNKEHQ